MNSEKSTGVKKYNNALIIDDDTDLCLLLKAMLNKLIPSVHCENSLTGGRAFLQQNKPDVIFLDHNLPDGLGTDFIKEVREFSPGAVIVLISAINSIKNDGIENGADIFLEKPLTFANVTTALTNAGELRSGS